MGRQNWTSSTVFLIIWILFVLEFFEGVAEICEKIDDCSCKKSNGKEINLRKIDGGSKPAFSNIKGISSTHVYAWNPCTKFNQGDGCSDVLMCQEVPNSQTSYPCATTAAKFEVQSDGITYITYESESYGGHKRNFQIGLKCDENEPLPGVIDGVQELYVSDKETGYTATLTSRCACDEGCPVGGGSGLSAGSILLIVFFVLIIVYLIGGILINKYRVGVKSMPEMCPNYEFWSGLPSLIKDGVVFTCSGIKSACSSLYQKCNKDSYANI